MNIKKTVIKEVYTTDNKKMEVGKMYMFLASGKAHVGKFEGFTVKNALLFSLDAFDCKYAVLPKSVDNIREVEIRTVAEA